MNGVLICFSLVLPEQEHSLVNSFSLIAGSRVLCIKSVKRDIALDEISTATCKPSEIATWKGLKFRRVT